MPQIKYRGFFACLVFLLGIVGGLAIANAEQRFITVASTTSTENSGLYDYLLPIFTRASGIEVRVVAVGTGKAIKIAELGDADVLLVHHKPSEIKFVVEGYGINRFDLMYNDFVLVGPQSDPARVKGIRNIVEALRRVATTHNKFVSRGDESGTHKKEKALWQLVDPNATPEGQGWYLQTGSGMGSTLNVASAMNAYVLTDRATWLKFANKGDLEIVSEGDSRLFNQYGITRVSEQRFPHVKAADARQFIDWLLSASGQSAINAYKIHGQQAFFANARFNN